MAQQKGAGLPWAGVIKFNHFRWEVNIVTMIEELPTLTPEQEDYIVEFIRKRQAYYEQALIQDVSTEITMLLFKEKIKREYGARD